MVQLTSTLVASYPYSAYADPQSLRRGRAYYDEERVWDMSLSSDRSRAICTVIGDSGEYTVEIELDQSSGNLYFDCDCPYAENHFCKHMVAAALELRDFLEEEEGTLEEEEDVPSSSVPRRGYPDLGWQIKLDQTLANVPRSETASNAQRYAAVLLLTKEEYYAYSSYNFLPFIVKAKSWNILQSLQQSMKGDTEVINDLLEQNPEWIKYGEQPYSQISPAGCLNLPPEAVSFLNFLLQYTRFFGGAQTFASFFPMIAQLQIPVFLGNRYKRTVKSRVHIFPEPQEIQVLFTREEKHLILRAAMQLDNTSPAEGKAEVISYNPPWLLVDDKLIALKGSSNPNILSSFPIKIPETQADLFREKYLRRIAESLPVKSDLIHWHDIQTDPVPRLYLHDDQRSTPQRGSLDKGNMLRADLRFGYGDYELAASKSEETVAVKTVPDSWDLIRIHRQVERELHFYQLLTDPIYRVKRADNSHPFGTFELRARAHPFDFLMYSVPLLTQAGFEIYGEEGLKAGRINRSTPTLRVQITSGIDWFDLKAMVEFGDQQISLNDLRKAMKRGERYVKLADGSVGQIPEEWLQKYRHLWNLSEETEEGFRLNDVHLPLLDSLLEAESTIQIPPDLAQRRERLRLFERIAPKPLPEGFAGELRPYQKHGFDWLHFLKEYKFGGILADDMGLGKTVQVLAYLQSQREQAPAEKAALLVVPKSLIANWQRESEKFTPGLRFLEYMGGSRNKDTSVFDHYDVVLTTYGTMLRDVEILRGYKFSHIILDESQAIKNPLAKSARAARLLHADHRLVMTGTPVENNTFELWSQFAFLNPGLLGSMDYFKREFATPIESGGDQESAALLRKLVYPFILRRTKEQVAPELPLRTERVVYTDMDPAQKKIYTQTRERYRLELLGLIESEGMNQARFRILEGLLRLRQIAIHPALVEKSYKGEAPKFEFLLETLETLQAEQHKALIFSQFVETLKLVRRELDKRGVKYVYLDGQTPKRQSRVDLFQNDPSLPFFLISLKAGGVGLNLTAADYVIHLDPWWNPAVEMQASDRAHRIGQEKPVFVYKIIARDTVEEKILQLQEKKRALVKSIITTEASFFKSLTKEDVKGLFS